MGFLVNKNKMRGVAHIFEDGDTLCKMYSTGGILRSTYEELDDNLGKPICRMCAGNYRKPKKRRSAKRVKPLKNGSATPPKEKNTLRVRTDGGPTEYQLQADIVKWMRENKMVFTCGQEGVNKTAAARLKAWEQGQEAGHPDLTIFADGGRTFFVELKTTKGAVRGNQRDRHEILRGLGFSVLVIKTDDWREAVEIIKAEVWPG